MNKIGIIIQREFYIRIKKKSFILLTILMPFLIATLIFVPALLSKIENNQINTVTAVDLTDNYSPLQKSAPETIQPIPPNHTIKGTINDASSKSPTLTTQYDENNESIAPSSTIAGIVGTILSLFIFLFILSYGSMVMQGVMEEKTNRIVEIIISSIKPYQLMFGKIAGIAIVGLFQFLIWALMLLSITLIAGNMFHLPSISSIDSISTSMSFVQDLEISQILKDINFAEIIVLYILYFIGGYLLFAGIFAAIGASINEQQDSQQFMTPIIIILIFALYAGIYSTNNPDGPLAFWCSFIPFTSPIVMMVRIPFNTPLWQIVLSLVILYATSAFIIWVSARIYRVGILMYGKKPSIKEMLKWIHYK